MLLIDADNDCPAQLGPRLAATVAASIPATTNSLCVVAKRMFENWIVAGAGPLAGLTFKGAKIFPDTLPTCDQPESIRGAAWLDGQLRSVNKSRKYKKTEDAKVFVKSMDIAECREKSPSFERLVRKLRSLIGMNETAGDELAEEV